MSTGAVLTRVVSNASPEPLSSDAGHVYPLWKGYDDRAGAGRRSDVEQFDEAITDLARVIALTAIASELGQEYAPVVAHLAQARRALRDVFGKAPS